MSVPSITMTQEFASSAERVFAALDDHANMGRWLKAKITLVKSVPDAVGSVRRIHLGLSSLDEEVTEREAPTRVVYRIVRGLFPLSYHRGEINVTDLGTGRCRVVWQIAIDSKIPLVAPIVRAALKVAIGSGLARLERQLTA